MKHKEKETLLFNYSFNNEFVENKQSLSKMTDY